MLLKIHQSYRKVVAICDEDLLGKTFEEGNKTINVRPNFFEGEKKTEQEILEVIEKLDAEDATFNIVGKESIATALKAGIINQEGIIKIQEIPVALVLL